MELHGDCIIVYSSSTVMFWLAVYEYTVMVQFVNNTMQSSWKFLQISSHL